MIGMQTLHDWFSQDQRDFPWRLDPSPYKVWISEVMLQQTRASVVVPYFLRWMEQFPTIHALAKAPLEAVIKAWEGLGYYSRARNLHAAACQVVDEFDGRIPSERSQLEKLKGLGPYTVNAILSFAFHQRAAPVDGNVVRVVSRYFSIEENVGRVGTKKKIEKLAEEMLDQTSPWVTAEALIELGATICVSSRPRCENCPLQKNCLGFLSGKAMYLPIKNRPAETIRLHRGVAVVVAEGKVLVKKGESGKVMADLYEFPFWELDGKNPWEASDFISLSPVEHTFTRYKARLHPRLFFKGKIWPVFGYDWLEIAFLPKIPFSSGHKKILQEVLTHLSTTSNPRS